MTFLSQIRSKLTRTKTNQIYCGTDSMSTTKDLKFCHSPYSCKWGVKYFCTPIISEMSENEYVKDLTRYGVESNPGPVYMCVCENREMCSVLKCPSSKIIFSNNVLESLEHEVLMSETTLKQYPIYFEDSDHSEEFLNTCQLQSFDIQTPVEITPETDYIIKLTENILTFVRLVSKAKDTEDYALAVAVFAQCRADRSLTSLLLEQWNRIMSISLQDEDSENNFQKFKNILNQYENIKKLPIFEKLYRFLMYCIGTSLFEKMGVKFNPERFMSVEKAAIKKEFHMGPDFIHCILDTVVFISETGYQCMVTGSIDPIFHHESTYEKWISAGEELRVQSKYITNPEPHGFTVFDFLSRLDECVDKGKNIVKFIGKKDPAVFIIRRLFPT